MANVFLLERSPESSDLFSSAEAIAKFGQPNVDPKLCKVRPNLKTIDIPFSLRLYSRGSVANVNRLTCHKIIAPYLIAALQMVETEYGQKEIVRLGLDVYAGCFNPRPIRGGKSWSKHAFGIATDWLPAENGLNTKFEKSQFAKPEYKRYLDIFQMCGFANLGRVKTFGRDAMHMEFMKTAESNAKAA